MRLTNHKNTSTDYRRARALRNNASPVEQKLWPFLREAAAAEGLKFRRQQVIHPYITDFACMKARLLVELDGDTHAHSTEYDAARDKRLEELGFVVVRYFNGDVTGNPESVAMDIVNRATRLVQKHETEGKRRSPLPDPPRKGEGTLSSRNGEE
ncbi:MAG: DUF559 domain-containing protein [Alphaproteobacteria bacterium]|nr:DUF559 domain-containing protein [Alphaproteobacteria bacterium]